MTERVISARGAVFDTEGRILLLTSSHSGKLVLPGGRVEEDEAPEEGLRREIYEEMGIKYPIIQDLLVVATGKDIIYDQQKIEFIYQVAYHDDFLTEHQSTHSHEISERIWLDEGGISLHSNIKYPYLISQILAGRGGSHPRGKTQYIHQAFQRNK